MVWGAFIQGLPESQEHSRGRVGKLRLRETTRVSTQLEGCGASDSTPFHSVSHSTGAWYWCGGHPQGRPAREGGRAPCTCTRPRRGWRDPSGREDAKGSSGHPYLGMHVSGQEGPPSRMEKRQPTAFPFPRLCVTSPGGPLHSSHELRGRER